MTWLNNPDKSKSNIRKSKGIYYFNSFDKARDIRNKIRKDYPEARIVQYKLGFAVQYRLSGPYYPELEVIT